MELEEVVRRILEKQSLEDSHRYYSFYPGTCRNPVDPEGRGRIKVEVPLVSSRVLPNWAPPKNAVFGAVGEGRNVTPGIGSPVTVEFQGGDINRPYFTFGSPTLTSKQTSVSTPPPTPTLKSIDTTLIRFEVDDAAGTLRLFVKPAGPELELRLDTLASLTAGLLGVDLGSKGLVATDGVVTGKCACAYTGAPHPVVSLFVRARGLT